MPRVKRIQFLAPQRFSNEVWQNIAKFICNEPAKVYMLLRAIKWLDFDDEFYKSMWEIVKPYEGEPKPQFLMFYNLKRTCQYRTAFDLLYMKRCHVCHCRFGHQLFEPYCMRLCSQCLQGNHISNVVLWKQYGIGLEEIGKHYMHYIRYIQTGVYRKEKDLMKFSLDPRDFAVRRNCVFIFFWLPDLRRFIDIDCRAKQHQKRTLAANVLKAAFARAYARRLKPIKRPQILKEQALQKIVNPPMASIVIYGTDWSQSYKFRMGNSRTPSTPEFDVRLAFSRACTVKLLGPREYTLRTMAEKFNLDKEGVARKLTELSIKHGGLPLLANRIFEI